MQNRSLLLLWMLGGCAVTVDGAASRTGGSATVDVKAVVVTAQPVPVVEETLATLVADARLDVRSEAAGQVATVSFEDGDEVEAGAELMRLRDASWRADLARAQAELTRAAAARDRTQALFDRERVSQAELQDAQAAHDLAAADVSLAREALRRTVVHTPFGGRLSRRMVEPGDVVDTSTIITRLVDADPLFAELSLAERHLGWIAQGLEVSLTVAAWPHTRFAGEVTYVEPEVDPVTRTVRLRARVEDPDHRLSPGMSATAAVTLRSPEPAIVVPAASVTTRAAGPMVWVVQDGVVASRDVVLGPRRPDDVVVLKGLTEGDEVVTHGLVRLREGGAVRIVTEGAP